MQAAPGGIVGSGTTLLQMKLVKLMLNPDELASRWNDLQERKAYFPVLTTY